MLFQQQKTFIYFFNNCRGRGMDNSFAADTAEVDISANMTPTDLISLISSNISKNDNDRHITIYIINL